jgi:hypothetical protein
MAEATIWTRELEAVRRFINDRLVYEENGFVEAKDMCFEFRLFTAMDDVNIDFPRFVSMMAENDHPIRPSAAGRSGYVHVAVKGGV